MIEIAGREAIARESLEWYGTKKKKPYRIEPETWEQVLFFSWLHKYFPEVWEVSFSTGNDLKTKLNPKTVNIWKSAGLKKGIPDVVILYPSRFYHGCLIEMKNRFGGKASNDQIRMCELFRMQHYYVQICHGFPNAAKAILRYLYDYN